MSISKILHSKNPMVCKFLRRNVMAANSNQQLRKFSLNLIKINQTTFKTPYCVPLRNHYYNTEYHPKKIVRAYRKTRTWLTEHFVLSDRRIENIYSVYIMGIAVSAFCFVNWFYTLSGGPNAGLDVDKTQKKNK